MTLLASQMPAHAHAVHAYDGAANTSTVAGSLLANGAKPSYYSDRAATTSMNSGTIGSAGGNQPFSLLQPYLSVTFIIALQGIFPSRG